LTLDFAWLFIGLDIKTKIQDGFKGHQTISEAYPGQSTATKIVSTPVCAQEQYFYVCRKWNLLSV